MSCNRREKKKRLGWSALVCVIADLLHDEELKESPPWHVPFHRAGTGPSPWSLKLLDSGQIPAASVQSKEANQNIGVV